MKIKNLITSLILIVLTPLLIHGQLNKSLVESIPGQVAGLGNLVDVGGNTTAPVNGDPSNLLLTILSDTSIKLAWTSNSTNQVYNGYYVERSTDGANYTVIDTVTSDTVTNSGLTTGVKYYYRVRAFKGTKYSAYATASPKKPVSGLSNWRAAVSAIDGGANNIYNVNFHGNSIVEGYTSALDSTIFFKGFVGLIRDTLALRYGNVGNGFITHCAPWDYRFWKYTGTWSYGYYAFNRISRYSTDANSTATLHFNGTGLVLMCVRGSNASYSGTFDVQIDGGSWVNFTNYDAELTFAQRLITVSSGLADGNHTAVIKLTGTRIVLAGAYAIKGTKGFRVNMLAQKGIGAELMSRDQFETGSPSASKKLSPVLTIIAMVTNDITLGTAKATYKEYMQTMITAAKTTGDVILVLDNVRTDKSAAQMQDYIDAVNELGVTNGCPVIDIYSDWGINGDDLGYMADLLHPNFAGHKYFASKILEVL